MKNYINSKWIATAMLAGVMTFSGCQKYLDLAPKNATYDQIFWVNGASVQKALSGSYSMLRDAFRKDRSYFVFGDLAADNFALGGDYWNYTSLVKSGNFRFGYAPYLEGSLWNWNRFYAIVNQCHLIIENTPTIDPSKFAGGEAEQKQLEGEARFLRAYTYFYMQRVWGDVILTTHSLEDPQNVPDLGRAKREDIMAFIKADIEEAINLLEITDNKTRASKGAAQALLSHFYAWNHDYINAEKYCDEVIAGQYSLENIADYKNIWKGGSKESIFEINMLFDAVSNEATEDFFNVFLTGNYINDRELKAVWSINDDVKDLLFKEEEARKQAIMETSSEGARDILIKYAGVDYFDPNDETSYVVSNNLVIFRLADIYLLRAEARFKNGNELGALADLNFIRARAGLELYTGSGNSLFDEIFDERRRELIGEGHTQFDLIRMEQLSRLFPDEYSLDRIAKEGYYWPLQMRELLPQAPKLTQNEWWKNH